MNKILKSLKVEPENYSLLMTVYYSFFASGVMSIILGTLLPYIKDANSLSYSQSGLMISAHQLGNLTAVLIAGVLPYLIGPKKSAVIMGTGPIVGLVLMTLTGNPWLLIAAFTLTGIGRGTMSNICNVVISKVSGNKSVALNVLHGIFALGALTSPVIVFVFTRKGDNGWKLAAFFAAALTAAACVLIARSNLSGKPESKDKEAALIFLKDSMFWINTMILFFYLCAEASIIGWFVVYFQDTGILGAQAAKFTVTLLWTMVMVGRFACAAISGYVNKTRLLLALSISFILFFTGLLLSKSAVSAILCLLGIGLSMAGIYPTTFSTIKVSSSAVATGFVISIAGAGGILMPGIVGKVADMRGLTGGVSVILAALVCMVGLIIMKLLLEKRDGKPVAANNFHK